MSHFAHITNGVVDNVIVAEQDFIDSGAVGDSSEWIECEKHYTKGLGKQAGVGYEFHSEKGKFIAPKPFDSFVLNEDDEWEAPVKKSVGEEYYDWNEAETKWEPVDKTKIV